MENNPNQILYNRLLQAKSFLEEDKKRYISKIESCKARIDELKRVKLQSPKTPADEFNDKKLSLLLLLLFVWPIGIGYAIYFAFSHKRIKRKANEIYVEKMKELENQRTAILKARESADQQLKDAYQARKQYYSTYGACLEFIPDCRIDCEESHTWSLHMIEACQYCIEGCVWHAKRGHIASLPKLLEEFRELCVMKIEAEEREEKRIEAEKKELEFKKTMEKITNNQEEMIHQAKRSADELQSWREYYTRRH